MTRLFFIILLFANFTLAKNDFLLEGNLSNYQKILHIAKTNDATGHSYLGFVDSGDDGVQDSIVLIDSNTTRSSRYIEIIDLPILYASIRDGISTNANANAVIKQIIKKSGTNDTFLIAGHIDNLVGISPTTHGFVAKFDYVPPNVNVVTGSFQVRHFDEYNATVIMDILDLADTQTYIVSGSIYDNEGISSYSYIDNTGARAIELITDHAKKDIMWVAELDANLAVRRYYIRNISANADTQLMLDSQKSYENNITVMGYINSGFSAAINNQLYLAELNYTAPDLGARDLKVLEQYASYMPGGTTHGTGTTVDIAKAPFLGRYGEAGISAQIFGPNGFNVVIPASNNSFQSNSTIVVLVTYPGVDVNSNPWEFIDINCSAPIGHASIDTNAVYIITFPVARLPVNCQPPKFEYYVSDKSKAFIDKQWEWFYDKKTPIVWDRIYADKNDTADTSRILTNSFAGADYNLARTTVLHNQITENPRQFTLLQVDNYSQGNIVWDKAYPSVETNTTITKGSGFVQDLNGDMMFLGSTLENKTSSTNVNTKDCVFIKIDKYGNEIYEQYIGNFWDDECGEVAVEEKSQRPLYSEYVAVGSTFSTNGNNGKQAWAVKLRDSGVLFDLNYQWNLIGNPTDRNISAIGSKEGRVELSLESLGAHKYYFSFQDNQWLMNKTPIEPLDGFFLVSYDNSQQIFLQGTLIEQDFQEIQSGETGWVMLTTGKVVKNPKAVYDLYAVYVYRNGQYQSNPIVIQPGEGFWAKKFR